MLEISAKASRGIILSRWRTTKVLIRLCICTGWSAPLLFAYGINRFSHDVAHFIFWCSLECNFMVDDFRWAEIKIYDVVFHVSFDRRIYIVRKSNLWIPANMKFLPTVNLMLLLLPKGDKSPIWSAAWQNQQNDLCAQRRLRTAWASAQSDKSLRCPDEETLGP